jgi:hypothetical protein
LLATQASDHREIAISANEFVNLVVLDMDSYTEKYSSHCVRKNIFIPAWLATFADWNGISCSRVLQETLPEAAQQS